MRWCVWFVAGLTIGGCATTAPAVLVTPLVEEGWLALRVDCQPQDAEVVVDGVLQGNCARLSEPRVLLHVPAGVHELEVSAPGYRIYRSSVSGNAVVQGLTIRLLPVGGL
jgi:hypothetical protein